MSKLIGHDLKLNFDYFYKNEFTFKDEQGNTLTFVPEYRSEVWPQMSLDDAVSEGCEYITFNGVGL